MTTETASTQEVQEAGPRRGGCLHLGCLTRIAVVIAFAIALIVVIGETFDQGDDANQPVRGFDAGRAEEYARSDVTYFDTRHVFIARFEDGSFRALYDKSARQQELGSDCRIHWDEGAQLIATAQLPGFRGAFVEECAGQTTRTTWRADGSYASGAGYGDMDRFETSIRADGSLFVDTARRTCTRSRGVEGVPPFDVTTCKGAD